MLPRVVSSHRRLCIRTLRVHSITHLDANSGKFVSGDRLLDFRHLHDLNLQLPLLLSLLSLLGDHEPHIMSSLGLLHHGLSLVFRFLKPLCRHHPTTTLDKPSVCC